MASHSISLKPDIETWLQAQIGQGQVKSQVVQEALREKMEDDGRLERVEAKLDLILTLLNNQQRLLNLIERENSR